MSKTRGKSMRDDPKVKEMTNLLSAGRFSERLEIMEELKRWLESGVGGWGSRPPPREHCEPLEAFYQWLEARDRAHTARAKVA